MKDEIYKKAYHRVSANINLDAICDNIKETRKAISPGTRIMAVIKADGYGHGAVELTKVLDSLVDAYAVAIVEEGIELRKAGVDKPILILGYTAKEWIDCVIQYDLTQTIFQYEMAEAMSLEAASQGKTATIHIKLDTGMGRIGFLPTQESVEEILRIQSLKNIYVEGLFTHFACADMTDKSSANKQFQIYIDFAKKCKKAGIEFALKHVSNSAGIIDLPEANLNMVRSGISTYGLYPSEEVDKSKLILKPAMEIKTHISFIKELGTGHGIGYGSTYVTSHITRIATVPVGYGDGFPRQLSNKGRVLVHGKFAPIIGRICMDQFMIDITEIPEAKQDDVVTLVGYDGKERIPVEEPANLAGSFNYEFVCDVGKRIPRIYYQNGKPVSIRTCGNESHQL